MLRTLAALAAPWLLAASLPAGVDDSWRFVAPPPGDPFEHPPLRALPLAALKPADMAEAIV